MSKAEAKRRAANIVLRTYRASIKTIQEELAAALTKADNDMVQDELIEIEYWLSKRATPPELKPASIKKFLEKKGHKS